MVDGVSISLKEDPYGRGSIRTTLETKCHVYKMITHDIEIQPMYAII